MKKPTSRFYLVRWYQEYKISQEVKRLEKLVQDVQECQSQLASCINEKSKDLRIWAALLKSENAAVPPHWFYEKLQRESRLAGFAPSVDSRFEVYARYKALDSSKRRVLELIREFKSEQYLHHVFFNDTPLMIINLTLYEGLLELLHSYEDMILEGEVDHDFLQERMGIIVSDTEKLLRLIIDIFDDELKEIGKKLAEYSQ